MAALFYSPVDFTDASDLHQTVVKFIGWCSGAVALLNSSVNPSSQPELKTDAPSKLWLLEQQP